MSDLSQRLAMREQMIYEENVRLNREHTLLIERAPAAWEGFKAAFRDECWEVSRQSNLLELKVDERGTHSFDILRRHSYSQFVAVQSFTFKPSLPGISWMDSYNKKPAKLIEMAPDASGVCFTLDGKAIVLSRFVADRIQGVCP
jgi:hypothetical protein